MAHDHHDTPNAACPACEFDPFIRNNYFNGKLLVADDFIDETAYHAGKMRHHNARLHGWGAVCGLRVRPHDNPACRDRYVVVEPGSALDCCGHEILVDAPELVDVRGSEAVQALERSGDRRLHALGLCIRYAECQTENVPVLYDECGCDETRCLPNRILERFQVDVVVDPPLAQRPPKDFGKIGMAALVAKGTTRVVPVGTDGIAYLLDPAAPRQMLVLDLAHARATRVDLPGKGLAIARGEGRVYVAMEAASGNAAEERLLAVYDAASKSLLEWTAGQNAVKIAGSGGMAVELAVTTVAARRLVAVLGAGGQVLAWPEKATAPGLGTAQVLGTIPGGVTGIAASPDGKRLVAAAPAGSALKVFDLVAKAPAADLAVLPASAVPGVLAHAKIGATEVLVAADARPELHLVDAGTAPKLLGTLPLAHPAVAVADGGDGWLQAIVQDGDRFHLQSIFIADAAAAADAAIAAPQAIAGDPAVVAFGTDGDAGVIGVHGVTREDCADLPWRQLAGCEDCDLPNCVMLATIGRYRPGARMEDPSAAPVEPGKDLAAAVARIDNRRGRKLLASTSTLQSWIECLLGEGEAGQGPQGPAGPAGPGIDEAIAVAGAPVSAQILADTPVPGKRTLRLVIPPGANGADGKGIDFATALAGAPNSAPAAVLLENTPVPGKRTLQLTIPPGPRGQDGVGLPGPAGAGLEADLTQIAGTSWVHGTDAVVVVPGYAFAPFVPIRTREGPLAAGLMIVFTAPIRFLDDTGKRPAIDSRHVFEVLAERRPRETQNRPVLPCPCPLRGRVVAVGRDDLKTGSDWRAYVDKVIATGPPAAPDPALWQGFVELPPADTEQGVWAIAFLVTEDDAKLLTRGSEEGPVDSLWVKLRGDFVVDMKERAIDAEFVRARFPTGDRPKGAKVGVQGGLFESWAATGWDR
jgi:hypothetical protein